jgi:hypothetical protein
LLFRVRRLASATRTLSTGTPARLESARNSSASFASASGRKRLKIGSRTTGARKLTTSTNPHAPAAATIGHQVGNARASPTSPTITTEVSTAPTASDFARSSAQPRTVCVESPNRCSWT